MSWAMTNADVPELINEMITSVSENKWGHLADYQSHFVIRPGRLWILPAILIFTPIFLPLLNI